MEHQSQASSSSSVLTENDVIKKNTDCVYFIASPLTCRKGSECEYRHSDLVRLNPRDCHYWLNGNCLNLKCGFRHPPFDGFQEKQAPIPTGPSPHMFQTNAALPAYVPNPTNKPGVPCIFFQKGYCLKGDWCPFLHGPNPLINKVAPIPEAISAFQPEPSKIALGGVDKFTQEKKVLNNGVTNRIKVTPHGRSSMELECSVIKKTPHASVVSDFRDYKNITSVRNGNAGVPQLRVLDERQSMNGTEAGEISREPSPGFDVLVDDERRDARYYTDEDHYEMSTDHESHREHAFRDHYPRDNRVPYERTSRGSSLEKRPYSRKHRRSEVDELDLRHRLVNPKTSNGLNSVIRHEHDRDRRVEDRRLPRRDVQPLPRYENSVSSRLRGRIRLPERLSSPIDRDMVRSSDRGRLSPVRPHLSFQPGRRTYDRIKGIVEQNVSNGERNRRDITDHYTDFAAPKRLSELKSKKNGEGSGEHVVAKQSSFVKRKHLMLDDNKVVGNGASFEGPKPLQEILKRKRGEKVGTGGNPSNNEDADDDNKNEGQDSVKQIEENNVQSEDNIPVKDGGDQEYEAFEQEEGRYDYEQVADEELYLYDGDGNGDNEAEEEFHGDEEDDDDNFAKKMGVEFS